ncbi:MAG: hypothetical protein HZA29_00280 [Candidatus Omnitrophica bacterium]|nr:hypothetical protein [Candidatus Omnitrophota bacterium]
MSMLLNPKFCGYIFLAAVLSGALASGGCERRSARRVYTEVRVSPPAETQARPAQMTAGDPHAGLGDMPMDDTHAAVRRRMSSASGGPGEMAMPGAAGDMQMPSGVAGDQMQEMLDASATKPPLSWQTPDGWQESPGSGMRLATFRSADTGDPVECALISLSGAAGGLESNVARWMGQLKLEVLSGEKMQKFLASRKKIKTPDGLPATIIDLAGLQPESDPRAPSMIATILDLDSMTVFVKMTGSRGAVLKNRDKFEALCQSLKLN